jgi:YVTN family beta-propeller protein
MKNKKYVSFFLSAFIAGSSLLFSSCTQESNSGAEDPQPEVPKEHGIFVTNEGKFMSTNGEVSYIDLQSKSVKKTLFQDANHRPAGDVVQSMYMYSDKAFIVANNSNKIEVVSAATFQAVGVINNLQQPRYFTVANGKGYVTEWVNYGVAGRVSVINLSNFTVMKTIPVGEMPEKLLAVGNSLYVTNSDDNTLSVINTSTDAVEATITVDDSPNSLAVDANNKLWVLSSGKKVYDMNYDIDENLSTAGKLIRLNPANNTIEQTLAFTSSKAFTSNLTTNSEKNSLYFSYNDKVYRMETGASALPANPIINRSFYGLGVDPTDNHVFGAVTTSFTGNGKVIRYSPAGQPTDSFTVSIAPNGFVFK